MFKKITFLLVYLFIISAQAADNSSNPPQVVVSIKPIHALVYGVMSGVAEPYLLLQGGESPHSYSMKPSQIKQLHEANLVIWVGPELETFLIKTIAGLPATTKVLNILETGKNPFSKDKLRLLQVREGHDWESHHHGKEQETQDEHAQHENDNENNKQAIDAHIWLDPMNAIAIVNLTATQLIELDPTHAVQYKNNAHSLIQQLTQLHQALTTQLAPVKQQPFIVFHDAYQYLEQRYGLQAVGAVSLSPERSPSAKQLHHLHELIEEKQVRCIFVEPQFPPTLVNSLVEETHIKQGILDPLGSESAIGTKGYFDLLNNLALSLTTCLAR